VGAIFAKIFRDFAQIFKYSAQIFNKSKLLGVRLHLRHLHHCRNRKMNTIAIGDLTSCHEAKYFKRALVVCELLTTLLAFGTGRVEGSDTPEFDARFNANCS